MVLQVDRVQREVKVYQELLGLRELKVPQDRQVLRGRRGLMELLVPLGCKV